MLYNLSNFLRAKRQTDHFAAKLIVNMKVILAMRRTQSKIRKRIAVIGAGWNGAHIAKTLADDGYDVTLYEANAQIFSGISGELGIRIHAGPHYQNSPETRATCRRGFEKFLTTYPDLVNTHHYSLYAFVKTDANSKPSRVPEAVFRRVCNEFKCKGEINLNEFGFNTNEISAAYDLDEPSAALNPKLRSSFEKSLHQSKVRVVCNFRVSDIQRHANTFIVSGRGGSSEFDHVINTTSYKDLLCKEPLPFSIKPVYQICLTLNYEDLKPEKDGKPISIIGMDGANPCLMPKDNRTSPNEPIRNYVMTHGKWTIAATYESVQEAQDNAAKIDENFIQNHVKHRCEDHMNLLWPKFQERFQYRGFSVTVLAKLDTNTEFRGTLVFQDPRYVINVFPGKITNVFDAYSETRQIMEGKDLRSTAEGYRYTTQGVLAKAESEVRVRGDERRTCALQTFRDQLAIYEPLHAQKISASDINVLNILESLGSDISLLLTCLMLTKQICQKKVNTFTATLFIVLISWMVLSCGNPNANDFYENGLPSNRFTT